MDEQEFSLCNPSSFLAAGQLFTILLPMIKTQDELTASLLSDAPPLGVKYLAKSSAFFQRTRRRATLSVWRDASWRGGSRAERKEK